MNALHDYLASQLAGMLRARAVVVRYDSRRKFVRFGADARLDVAAESTGSP
jgi:hypothetical protein